MSWAELYYKVHQKDGREENFHLYVEESDVLLDLMNDLDKSNVQYCAISKKEFESVSADKTLNNIAIHSDKNLPGDAAGDYIGYLEHYEI